VGQTAAVADAAGDTQSHQPGADIVGYETSLVEVPGALTVDVSYVDLPARETTPTRTSIRVHLDGRDAEIDLNRSLSGDGVSVFIGEGEVDVEWSIDANADKARLIVRPVDGPLQERGGVGWAYAVTGDVGQGPAAPDVDLTTQGGACVST
jgi:hypothetical protein